MSLQVKNLHVAYGNTAILQNIAVDNIPNGQLTVLLGPNAAGKSTFFKAIAGLLDSKVDVLKLNEKDITKLNKPELSKTICYMPQTFSSNAVLSVFESILLARKTSSNWLTTTEDLDAVANAIHKMGIDDIAHRPLSELSGGQQQLTSFCQAMVRQADLYLLDEPTSALDLHKQLQVLELLKQEAKKRHVPVLVILHDLTLAAKYADNLIVMQSGEVVAHGIANEVLESGVLQSVYQVDIELLMSKQGHYVVTAQ